MSCKLIFVWPGSRIRSPGGGRGHQVTALNKIMVLVDVIYNILLCRSRPFSISFPIPIPDPRFAFFVAPLASRLPVRLETMHTPQ